jgi:hypothetical protein
VSLIDNRIDPVGRAFKLRAELPNPDLAAAGRHVHAARRRA